MNDLLEEKTELSEDKEREEQDIELLWHHALHEDNIFNDRLNFFLVIESILLAVIAMLFEHTNTNKEIILRLFMGLGFFLTIIWTFVSARQMYILNLIRNRIKNNIQNYANTIKELEKIKWSLSNTLLLSYFIPFTFIVIWILLQFVV